MLHITLIGGGTRIRKGRWINTPRISVSKPQGVEIRALNPDGTRHTGQMYGNHNLLNTSIYHAADLWTRVGQLMGLNITQFGDYIHNTGPLDL